MNDQASISPKATSPTSPKGPSRIEQTFNALRAQNRAAFIPFIMAGDPDLETSFALMQGLPAAGADIIELGVCFTDPMADGPAIQAAGLRALAAGQTLLKTLDMVARFRIDDDKTPIILMGYYNPFFAMGVERFLDRAAKAGVDGLIIVDLPPEEDDEMCLPARAKGLDFIRLATPTTDKDRLPAIIKNTSGFVYYVSVAGVTGQKSADLGAVAKATEAIKKSAGLPVGVGFGIKTARQAGETAQIADAVIVGSALVDRLAQSINRQNSSGKQENLENLSGEALENIEENTHNKINDVLNFAQELSQAVHRAR